MADSVVRIQVERFGQGDTRTSVLYVERPDDAALVAVTPLVDCFVRELAEATGLSEGAAREVLLCELVERLVDEQAFYRECERRGIDVTTVTDDRHRRCECGRPLGGRGDKRFCSDRCRQRAHRRAS